MPANPALARRTTGTDAAAVVVASLRRRGARHVFGMPGEALNALIEAMRVDGQLTMVSVRHEGYGSIMASSYAKVCGSIGVCVGASGPGTTHLALGVADAWADGVPLVALSGQVPLALVGKDVFQ